MSTFNSRNSVTTIEAYGGGRGRVFDRRRSSASRSLKSNFDYARRIWRARAGALRHCALVAMSCAFFDLAITFREISWQAQYFGHGGGLRRALFSW